MAKNTGSRVTAVPRSGSLAIRLNGIAVSAAPIARSVHDGVPRFSP